MVKVGRNPLAGGQCERGVERSSATAALVTGWATGGGLIERKVAAFLLTLTLIGILVYNEQ